MQYYNIINGLNHEIFWKQWEIMENNKKQFIVIDKSANVNYNTDCMCITCYFLEIKRREYSVF